MKEQILFVITWLLPVIALLETLFYSKKDSYHIKETLSNVFIYVFRRWFIVFLQKTIQISLLSFFYRIAPNKLSYSFLNFLLALLLVDFLYYCKHYCEHKVRILWTFHSVHHSSNEFKLSTALRLPWFGAIFTWVFYIPAVLIGFNPALIFLCSQLVLLYQFWIHSDKIPKLGLLERYFNTPSHHRVHHASNKVYLDKNFGGILMIWDRLFGTMAIEDRPIIYGLTKPLKSSNPLDIMFYEFKNFIKDIKKAPSLKEAIKICYNAPGYRPKNNSID